MPNFRELLAVGMLLCVVVTSAIADEQSIQPSQPKPASSGSGNIKVFDDNVFNLQSQQAPPPTTKTSPRGNTYYMAEDPNYNSQQRGQWMNACDHLKDNPQAYRDCFNSEKSADLKKNNPELINTNGSGKSAGPARNKNSIEKAADPYDSMKEDSQPEDHEH